MNKIEENIQNKFENMTKKLNEFMININKSIIQQFTKINNELENKINTVIENNNNFITNLNVIIEPIIENAVKQSINNNFKIFKDTFKKEFKNYDGNNIENYKKQNSLKKENNNNNNNNNNNLIYTDYFDDNNIINNIEMNNNDINNNNNNDNDNNNFHKYSVLYYEQTIEEKITKKENKKKSKIKSKIKIKNNGENNWPKNCVLCCNQKIEEINNYYFKDIEINNGNEVKKGQEIEVDVEILAKNKFNLSCEEKFFFINYEVKIQGIHSINKENGTFCIAYK